MEELVSLNSKVLIFKLVGVQQVRHFTEFSSC